MYSIRQRSGEWNTSAEALYKKEKFKYFAGEAVMKAIIVIIFGLTPVMLGASGKLMTDSSEINSRYSFFIADTNADQNNNITIVIPPKEEDQAGFLKEEQKQAEAGSWKTECEMETNFNTKDWMLGFGTGIQNTYGVSFLLRFHIRPLTNSVFVEKSSNVYRQYNERRMVLGMSAGWDYIIYKDAGIYINAGYGVSFAYFRGSDQKAETIITPMLGGGLLFQAFGSMPLHCGYEYIRTPEYPDHHINISAALIF